MSEPPYDKGAWAAFDLVLNWINTLECQTIDKSTLYKAVMDMRPRQTREQPQAKIAA